MKAYWNVQTDIPSGLYRVAQKRFVAGFEVRDGHVVACAPILRRRIRYWMKFGERIAK